ncbi:LysR family transcriptional regulator [Actinospica durhamensis]|uniref:LysR family transcriptional regulator n=1 Tax=Actinospica durhamensis TaxID=1508375 RepID=A0A941IT89_9ACTN|nr:LysR family transcriptional regulator [Actinospica durhamensis]MBR7834101.1 LysR family transcriptional regulator [Actinospica durhamensis]
MQIEELRWFATLCETGHMGQAAAELGLSQPGLSRALARLEAELGAPLFDRNGRVLALNRFGRAFLTHAERILAEDEAGRRAVAELASPQTGTVALAFLYTVGNWLVPRLLLSFRAEHPHVRFHLVQGGNSANLQALERGEVDLVITSPRPADPGLAWRALRTEHLYLAVPAGHRLAHRRRVRIEDAGTGPFVATRQGTGLRESTEQMWQRAGIEPQIAFESDDVPALRGLVAVGLGVAVLPRSRTYDGNIDDSAEPWLRYIPLVAPDASRVLGLTWRQERWASPAVTAFRDAVTALAPELP